MSALCPDGSGSTSQALMKLGTEATDSPGTGNPSGIAAGIAGAGSLTLVYPLDLAMSTIYLAMNIHGTPKYASYCALFADLVCVVSKCVARGGFRVLASRYRKSAAAGRCGQT